MPEQIEPTLFNKVKKALRITNNALDEEIKDTISACKKDLQISGVEIVDETDELIVQACKTYARSEFDYAGKGDRYKECYSLLKQHLALCGDYRAVD
jgi:hypothetical protein